ncbi:MAG: hypothetical protein JO306_09745 [Gemmatimonadetes bacterium]|nr:hypothetical protein [Gemmatimonadota bacterium]
MELSSVTLRVLLLFFPGVVCAMFLDALTVHRERTPVEFLTHSFALGMGSYLALATARDLAAAAARTLRMREPLDVTFFDALLNDRVHIAWREIVVASIVGVVLTAAIAAILNRRVILRVARGLRVSRKTGGVDVWNFLFDSLTGQLVIVRDLSHDMTYFGVVEVFSETSQNAELLLRNVRVYENSTSKKLYTAERVYLARDLGALVVEPLGWSEAERRPDAA